MVVVEVGCGAGFPLLELAERLGNSCRIYGVDTWKNALQRAKDKTASYGIKNVKLIEGSATKMPFADNSIDLIVSNLGINNFEEPEAVFRECHRVLKAGGRLALTTNLNGHWKTFYDIFEETLPALGEQDLADKLSPHQEHRGSIESISTLFTTSGFSVSKVMEEGFDMKFLDGTAFLNHHFVKLGWLGSWKSLIPEAKRVAVFTALEAALNNHAKKNGSLTLSVPMAFMEDIEA